MEDQLKEVPTHDLESLLCSSNRDFLIRNSGDQVKVQSLKGKKVGLYFSASWCGPCQSFTPKLVKVYNELLSDSKFEVVFVSADQDNESFDKYFSKMPWLAIPFSDSETRNRLDKLFDVSGIPHLVILDENGKELTNEGVVIIREYEAKGFPFTPERIQELKEQEEEAKRNQSLKSLLVSPSRDYVIRSNGEKVPVVELEGKIILLYFSIVAYKESLDFTLKLVEIYQELRKEGENFEIVMIPLDDEESSFKKKFEGIPWLSLPVLDKTCAKLVHYFELSALPIVVVIGPDGKTIHPNVAEVIEDHGRKAYPFTSEKLAEIEELEKIKRESQTLESILVSEDSDFVIGKEGVKVRVSELVGKNILLYFSAHWCPPCRAFLPKLIEAYHEIKAKDDKFEVIFISSDRDQISFDEFFSTMPWLAIPFGDKRKLSLSRLFKVQGIPTLVAVGPTGKTVTTGAINLITYHGADAYPFTEERIKEIEEHYEKMAEEWPKKVRHALHEEHELDLSKHAGYYCDGCSEFGQWWSFWCKECDFDLHPKCALSDKDKDKGDVQGEDEEKNPKEGWTCDGDMCHKA
ncbi:probable nucleoredoxin 1 [Olea europaea subsp. europaea]|uniref:protein-disulfide reductase n=2 Tax=Olea europaea subsp. europaea TaxID=158383 RepID=A0A8S0S1S4_OLEEU|nr:probable nucleoredoxin 1 [Olea europaea subsp. europaea]